jgi:hypothetical protein
MKYEELAVLLFHEIEIIHAQISMPVTMSVVTKERRRSEIREYY